MDEALAALDAGTLELFGTAAARKPAFVDYGEAIRQQDLGRSVVYDGEARNALGRSDRCEKRGGRPSNLMSTADLYASDDTKPYREIAAASTTGSCSLNKVRPQDLALGCRLISLRCKGAPAAHVHKRGGDPWLSGSGKLVRAGTAGSGNDGKREWPSRSTSMRDRKAHA